MQNYLKSGEWSLEYWSFQLRRRMNSYVMENVHFMKWSSTIEHNSPLPQDVVLKCHPIYAVAQNTDRIRYTISSIRKRKTAFKRPAYSNSFHQCILDTCPEAIVLKRYILDELLYSTDETLCHSRSGQQPVCLYAVCHH